MTAGGRCGKGDDPARRGAPQRLTEKLCTSIDRQDTDPHTEHQAHDQPLLSPSLFPVSFLSPPPRSPSPSRPARRAVDHVPRPLPEHAKTPRRPAVTTFSPPPALSDRPVVRRGGFNPRTMASSLHVSSSFLFSAARSSPVSLLPSSVSSAAAPCQCRSFSKAPALKVRGIPQKISLSAPPQPSKKVLASRELARTAPTQDFGLLPGTFIRPLWRDMPSFFEQPRQRLHLEWLSLKTAVQNFLGWVSRLEEEYVFFFYRSSDVKGGLFNCNAGGPQDR